jgi:hypothetical protein
MDLAGRARFALLQEETERGRLAGGLGGVQADDAMVLSVGFATYAATSAWTKTRPARSVSDAHSPAIIAR